MQKKVLIRTEVKASNGGRYQIYPDPELCARLENRRKSFGHDKMSMSTVICLLLRERLDQIDTMKTIK